MTEKGFITANSGDTDVAGTLSIAAPRALYAVASGHKPKKNPEELLPASPAERGSGIRLIKSEDRKKDDIINRPGRSTYPREKSVLTSGATCTRPLAYVQISSAALAAYGVAQCVSDLLLVVRDVGESQGQPTVSRGDPFVDVVTEHDLSRLEDEQWVTRAHNKARYAQQGQRSGYVIGQGSDISLRLYDKTLEIKGSGKDHARRQWRERGWDGCAT